MDATYFQFFNTFRLFAAYASILLYVPVLVLMKQVHRTTSNRPPGVLFYSEPKIGRKSAAKKFLIRGNPFVFGLQTRGGLLRGI